jgi:hypothetical protein
MISDSKTFFDFIAQLFLKINRQYFHISTRHAGQGYSLIYDFYQTVIKRSRSELENGIELMA